MEKEEKKEEVKDAKKRQIILETDGSSVDIKSAEVAGKIELIAILSLVIEYLKK